MSLTPHETSNRGRVLAALVGVALVLAFAFVVYAINQANKPEVVKVGKVHFRGPVAYAVKERLAAWQLTGQFDPDVVKGLSGKMHHGMSAWYPARDRARISTPGGCTVWLEAGHVMSYTKRCIQA
jgi:hypothetical protein